LWLVGVSLTKMLVSRSLTGGKAKTGHWGGGAQGLTGNTHVGGRKETQKKLNRRFVSIKTHFGWVSSVENKPGIGQKKDNTEARSGHGARIKMGAVGCNPASGVEQPRKRDVPGQQKKGVIGGGGCRHL